MVREEDVLLERNYSNLVVKVAYKEGSVFLELINGTDDPITKEIAKENALDAFYHPYMYVSREEESAAAKAPVEREIEKKGLTRWTKRDILG